MASFFRADEILISWRHWKGGLHDVEFNRSLKLWNRRSSARETPLAVSLLAVVRRNVRLDQASNGIGIAVSRMNNYSNDAFDGYDSCVMCVCVCFVLLVM